MHKYKTDTLTRISKAHARKIWGKTNQTISLCPHKLSPDGPWRANVDAFPEEQQRLGFDMYVTNFEWFNCTYETGYYAAFYLRGVWDTILRHDL